MKRWSLLVACLLLGGLIGTAITNSVLSGQNEAVAVLPKELTSYRDVVKKVLPAVVSIEGKQVNAIKQMRQRITGVDEQQVPEQFRRFFEQMNPGLPGMEGPVTSGFGSGFLVDPKGVILTNYHVVNGADLVEIYLKDGRKFQSKDIKVDAKTDLAIIRIETKDRCPSWSWATAPAWRSATGCWPSERRSAWPAR